MWKGEYRTVTDVPAQKLCDAIADVNNWNKWDEALEFARLDGPAGAGAKFLLKPKGGPNVKTTIDEMRPFRFVDTAHLLGARMRTTHEYVQRGSDTEIRFVVEVWGVLGFVWRRVVAENQVKEAPRKLRHSSVTRAPERSDA